jgi:hypothetical protein
MPGIGIGISKYLRWYFWRPFMSYLWETFTLGNFLISEFVDRRRITITNKDFSTVYIPGSSTATFKLQADADFKTDDSADHLWFDVLGNQRSVTTAELYSKDYTMTVTKTKHSAPYDVSRIGLLENGTVLTPEQNDQLHQDFELWLFWSGVLNEYGYIKENRTI